ncbi:MAG: hypothetical protein JNL82_28625 [Myxococcales bacterium]|nr:hypothetical protein [Myxococcales bacterium]
MLSLVVGSLLGVGCYSGAGTIDAVDEIESMRDLHNNSIRWNDIRWNDIKWNGIKWNDIKWNGIKWNDIKWNGIKWNGIRWNGIKWNSSSLDGSSIEVSRKVGWKWERRSGEQLIGMEVDLTVDVRDENDKPSTAQFVLRVDDIYTDGAWDDVYYYDISIGLKGSNTWEPLCADGHPAIPLKGYWNETTGDRINDHDVITFACTTGVLAHCVQWGYRPWAEAKRCDQWDVDKKWKKDCEKVSLRDYHQACTRMARADYCGTGEAWTVPGTPIDIYDHLYDQIESPETDWPVEAEWRTDGAYCLDDIRQQGWKAEGKYPSCKNGKAKVKSDCGSLKDHRALLVSKYEDDAVD